ncbi:Hypothetical predicted protein [Paramuricea clavata]|uniref:Dynein regulatory complex protein 12 n=1 Tax=Paramuricea clavata TaxID=317549 RepID=A0A7D9I7Y7_PARCT|nr:Hypothetical predicted protein [Paramuricea clavata]
MPPKKTVKAKKKKKKTAGEKTELTVEDKYKRTMEEIESLKVELATRTEHARRSRDMSARMEERMCEAQEEVIQEKEDKRDISTDLTRQYKMMQSELGLKIHILEQTVTTLRSQLGCFDHGVGCYQDIGLKSLLKSVMFSALEQVAHLLFSITSAPCIHGKMH